MSATRPQQGAAAGDRRLSQPGDARLPVQDRGAERAVRLAARRQGQAVVAAQRQAKEEVATAERFVWSLRWRRVVMGFVMAEKLHDYSSNVVQLEGAKSENGSEDDPAVVEAVEEHAEVPSTTSESISDYEDDEIVEKRLNRSIHRPVKLVRMPLFTDDGEGFGGL